MSCKRFTVVERQAQPCTRGQLPEQPTECPSHLQRLPWTVTPAANTSDGGTTLLRSYRKTRSCGLDLAGERLSGKGLVAEAPLCVIADGLLAVLERTEEEHPPENLAGGLRGVWRN